MYADQETFGTSRAIVEKYGIIIVIALLVLAVGTAVVSARQSSEFSAAYSTRDTRIADQLSNFVGGIVRGQKAGFSNWYSRYVPAFQTESPQKLKSTLEQYMTTANGYERAVAVTDLDGKRLVSATHPGSELPVEIVDEEMEYIARAAIRRKESVISGRIDVGGRSLYALAHYLPGANEKYGAWTTVYDIEASPIGLAMNAYKLDKNPQQLKAVQGSAPAVVDDRGRVLFGNREIGELPTVEAAVQDTVWMVLIPTGTTPGVIPTWIFVLIGVGIVILIAMFVLSDGTRRAIQREESDSAVRLSQLYEFAGSMLRSSHAREQAENLTRAICGALPVSGARVRLAADLDLHGIVCGQASPTFHQYRIALKGRSTPLGELIVYTQDLPLFPEEQAIVQTYATMAGMAMHTLVVLERERDTGQELMRLDDLRTNLLSTVAHELRSPLTAVKGVLSLLAMQQELSEKQREYVDIALLRTDSLVALIQELFDCSLLEAGQLTLKAERVRATELLEKSLGALAASRSDEVHLSATPNLMMTVDPLRFDQIVNNLVTNAFRHGKAPVEVQVRPYAQGSVLIVQDSGPGIPVDERHNVFNKFYQSDAGKSRLVEGAGLGLALVHGLVQLHGGHIEIDSARLDGTGAVFRIYFPDVAPVHESSGGKRGGAQRVEPAA